MKYLFFVCTAMMSLTQPILAATPASSLEEIVSEGFQVEIPKILLGGVAVAVTNVCYTPSELKTKNPIKVCAEYGRGTKNSTCLTEHSIILSKSRFYTSRTCTRYSAQHECVNWANKDSEYQLSYKVPVYQPKRFDDGRGDRPKNLSFYKDIELDQCR